MISRVAEHCFWLARYLERAENTARILEVNQTLLLDFHVPVMQQWLPLLIISGIHDYKGEPSAEAVQAFMTWDSENPFSIVSSLHWARENARIIRETISAEMWERMGSDPSGAPFSLRQFLFRSRDESEWSITRGVRLA